MARLVLTLLPDTKKREFAIDRTNWKLGRTDVNALFLAVIWGDRQGLARSGRW
ncbi:hypothetical protein BOO71_0014623 [Deinococcus marmoris]|uniref:Uncharacterized protein n=1 Tax=Deinococcus marmoris TaxID=249408 RepID=A0A1U7NRJ4_9DEIO|nr:hypothetical protein BOO71_0014623 [Deinococcus marmoris]